MSLTPFIDQAFARFDRVMSTIIHVVGNGGFTDTSPIPSTTYPLRPSGKATSIAAQSFRYLIRRTGSPAPGSTMVNCFPWQPLSLPLPTNTGVAMLTLTVCFRSLRTSLAPQQQKHCKDHHHRRNSSHGESTSIFQFGRHRSGTSVALFEEVPKLSRRPNLTLHFLLAGPEPGPPRGLFLVARWLRGILSLTRVRSPAAAFLREEESQI